MWVIVIEWTAERGDSKRVKRILLFQSNMQYAFLFLLVLIEFSVVKNGPVHTCSTSEALATNCIRSSFRKVISGKKDLP